MDSTKKKSSRRLAEKNSDKETSSSSLQDVVMGDAVPASSGKSKKKLTSSDPIVKKKKKTESESVNEEENTDDQNSSSSSQQTTTTTSSTVTVTSTSTPVAGGGVYTPQVPVTPLNKVLLNTSTFGTPMSPNKAAQRLKEKEELISINKKLIMCLKQLEEKNNELDRKDREYEQLESSSQTTIVSLKKIVDQAEKQLTDQAKTKTELTGKVEQLESELKSKEEKWQAEENEFYKTLNDKVNQLNNEYLQQVNDLKSEGHKKDFTIATLNNEVKRVKEELHLRIREGEQNINKLLDAEYHRIKNKEDEMQFTLNLRDEEIKKLKSEFKDKEKQYLNHQRKENELNQTIQALQRQLEDVKESQSREWEIQMVTLTEQFNERTQQLQDTVNGFEEEKNKLLNIIKTTQNDLDQARMLRAELEDKINSLETEISNRDQLVNTANSEKDKAKKQLRQSIVDIQSREGQISQLQAEINIKEEKVNNYQGEVAKLKYELNSVNREDGPEILLTREINSLKEIVNGFEKIGEDRDRKRKRGKWENESGSISSDVTSMEGVEQVDPNAATDNRGTATQSLSELRNQLRYQISDFKPDTATFSLISSKEGFICISVHGDTQHGLSISGWKLIVVRPDGTKVGFSFPENIAAMRNINQVTVWTGLNRPQTRPTEDEFYWSRPDIWPKDNLEGTIVKLVSPSHGESIATLNSEGVYMKPEENKSNCLIM